MCKLMLEKNTLPLLWPSLFLPWYTLAIEVPCLMVVGGLMETGQKRRLETKPFGPRLAIPGAIVLLTFLSLGIWFRALFPPLWLHLVLAVGLFPLIVGSMIFFAGPLTRSGPPEQWVTWLPLVALAVGIGAVWGVNGVPVVAGLAALSAMVVCGLLLFWMQRRSTMALGGANPGLRWYQAALLLLLLGMAAILIAILFPQWWLPMRQAHMHLNLLGFVGLTAVGTLQVFLPTVGHYPDPEVGLRLRRDLKYALGGAFLLALAASLEFSWLSWLGRLLWLISLFHLLVSLWRHRREIWQASGAATSLVIALLGFVWMLLLAPPVSLALFIGAFLLPLVTAALSHLLPLWWWPAGPAERRTRAQVLLGRGGAVRGLLFLVAGGSMYLGHYEGAVIAVTVVVVFGMQVLLAARAR